MRQLWLILVFLWTPVLLSSPSGANEQQALKISLPVDCKIGKTCFVQNHFDRDPGPGFLDYACGILGYDGHTGIDIRVADLPAMARGVAVIAAAPGRVNGVRDGMTDIDVRLIDAATIEDRKAGNAVVIDHGGSWHSQYSHLRRGSIRVAEGDSVAAGDVLGMIGMSGNTAFPHLEFAVRHQGRAVDPFGGLDNTMLCKVSRDTLWDKFALAALSYTPSGLLAAGFASRQPNWQEARRGDYAASIPRRDAPALVFWISLFGGQQGDKSLLRLIGPNGDIIGEGRFKATKDQPLVFSFTGRKRTETSWPEGVYRGEFTLIREIDGAPRVLLSTVREITLR
ncbi:MAG: M23 family metallopeptidase [Alphaproteobacteria bacterium]|jgi:hypothetical protein